MDFKVRVFLGEKELSPEEVKELKICNTSVDRIVNDVVDRNSVSNIEPMDKAVAS